MSDRICLHVTRYISGRPMFMLPEEFQAKLAAIGPRLGMRPKAMDDDEGGQSVTEIKRSALMQRLATIIEADHVDVGDGMGEYGRTKDGVAVISIVGPLTNRYDWFSALCGFCSYDVAKAVFTAAINDPAVKAVLLDIDSPGGEAAGFLDCADLFHAGATVKPTWASANTLAASAGYGLAAAASRLTVPRLGTVGSVGVVGIHVDQSGWDKEMGLKYTPIFSGAQKIDGWGHAPLDKDALSRIQARFDESRRKFAEAVGHFRGMSLDDVLETEAGVFDDDAAVDIGFADAVSSFEETLGELTDLIKPRGAGTTVSFAA